MDLLKKVIFCSVLLFGAPILYAGCGAAQNRLIQYKNWEHRNICSANLGDVIGKILFDLSSHMWWIMPFSCLMGGIISTSTEQKPLQCSPQEWRPMISLLANIYMPFTASTATTATSVQKMFQENVHWLCFNFFSLWEKTPDVLVPTIEHNMSPSDLETRKIYFGSNYAGLLVIVILLLEGMKRLFKVCTCILEVMLKAFKTCGSIMGMTPTCENKIESSINKQLVEERQQVGRIASFPRIFILWCIMFQIYVWINTDVAVHGGLINTSSGMAWEASAPLLHFEVWTHVICAIVRYCITGGRNEQSPGLLILPCLMPWLGSSVHIWQDHIFTGLRFSLANCNNGSKRHVALILGYSGVFIHLYFVCASFSTKDRKVDTLREAHCPILEASRSSVSSVNSMSIQAMKSKFLTTLIGMSTKEKKLRTVVAEVPHLVLHLMYVFLFGGSAFVYTSTAVSLVKLYVFLVPQMLKSSPEWILYFSCSLEATRKLWYNVYEEEDDEHRTLWKLAWTRGMRPILHELFQEQVDEACNLQELDLQGAYLEDAVPLFQCLAHFPHIRKVNLAKNKFGAKDLLKLLLAQQGGLQIKAEVNWNANLIQDVSCLAEALRANSSLESLHLGGNSIQARSIAVQKLLNCMGAKHKDNDCKKLRRIWNETRRTSGGLDMRFQRV